MRLVELLRDDIEGIRSTAIPAHLQVLAVLMFFSEGALQKGVAHDLMHPVCQSTVSRMITRVVDAILVHADRFIRFPQTREERQRVQSGYIHIEPT